MYFFWKAFTHVKSFPLQTYVRECFLRPQDCIFWPEGKHSLYTLHNLKSEIILVWSRACLFSWALSSTVSTLIKWSVWLSVISPGLLTQHRYSVLRADSVVSTSFAGDLRITHVANKTAEIQDSKAMFPLGSFYVLSEKKKPGFWIETKNKPWMLLLFLQDQR